MRSLKDIVSRQPRLRIDPNEPYQLLAVWYKVIVDDAEKLCILYVYEWSKSAQYFPSGGIANPIGEHDWGYEPIIYCKDQKSGVVTWTCSGLHYAAGSTKQTNVFDVTIGTHGYSPNTSGAQGSKEPESKFKKLDFDTLADWERKLIDISRYGYFPQLSLLQAFTDPCNVKDAEHFTTPKNGGKVTQETDKYRLYAGFYFETFGLDRWVFYYTLSNQADTPISSLKLCFDKDPGYDADDVTIRNPRNDARWKVGMDGNCLVIECEKGFGNTHGIKKLETLDLTIDGPWNGDVGIAEVAVNRGPNNVYADDEPNVDIPGPVARVDFRTDVASAPATPGEVMGIESLAYLKAIGPTRLADFFRNEHKTKTETELANEPLDSLKGINKGMAEVLLRIYGLKKVKDLATVGSHPLTKLGAYLNSLDKQALAEPGAKTPADKKAPAKTRKKAGRKKGRTPRIS